MRIRKNFLPLTATDFGACLLISVSIPVTYIFEMVVVVPEFHSFLSISYCLTSIVATFLVFNIKANMLAVMMVDTSIKHELLSPPDNHVQRKTWRFCSTCETLAPPRSWHCRTCKSCILKRDHHCMFTGCCIGHKNHRYFLMFLIYFFIGTLYTTVYNSIFLWYVKANEFANYTTILKIFAPLFMFTIDSSMNNLYLLIYELNIIGLAYSFVLILYHGQIVMKGGIVYEHNLKSFKYDLGWKDNLVMIFGKKWHLVWLSPFFKSHLPMDGIHWENVQKKSHKTK